MSESSIFSRVSDFKAIIRFVKQIERHPCLYDQNSKEYSDRALKRRTWVEIAESNNCSVADAKMKWTKIRIAYIRTLRPSYQKSGNGTHKKTYYLAKYLKFIQPTKFRKISDNYCQSNGSISENSDTKEQDEKINEKHELLTEYDSEDLDEQELNPQHEMYLDEDMINDDGFDNNEEMIYDSNNTVSRKEVISNEINKMPRVKKHKNSNKHRNSGTQNSWRHCRDNYHQKSDNQQNCESHRNSGVMQRNSYCDSLECNPRKMFLFSLMPDIQKLSENQMRNFRRQVIQILDNVISE